ncbi:hypothetical protein RB614_42615 [Phytohabitans sp. ZYX-F-186]|uniref:Uncharacterized protein n=1 Tax=Phytohabitans maris TaxID=3071409 RepID=A0ABU0ZVZ0_9ACTN|nr:hypothetical protein [Phytohabitans sp. ZYX-F-186]MDQ7911203.1 hypothetical protein [Phytohabitans sp. ZYX-F-186]
MDRFVEIDLFWFDHSGPRRAADEFWERMAPLFAGVDGWRGVIVNLGWLADHVLDWRGSLDAPIPLPRQLTLEPMVTDRAPLTGTVAERMAAWRERFARSGQRERVDYPPWTYRELAALLRHLRESAAAHGVPELKVGTFVIGWESVYASSDSGWARRHPAVFVDGPWPIRLFDVTATLSADPTGYGAYPDGVAAGTRVAEYFGRQWGSLSRAVGLDAIVLRDSMMGAGVYERVGIFGETAHPDPDRVARWSAATADLVRQTKLANPDALVIGYSNGASAVGGWRVNCVDLESVAREGHLDAWIDQTWAGAWNEVGQRAETFWNRPPAGWTYQLGNVLLHAAMLAGTRTRHYPLVETFDAWESWNVIHTARQRLAWGIWAYQHAFVKTPGGLVARDGAYVSWANQGRRLLSRDDVAFLAETITAATADARETTRVFGPTLVYHRPAMRWQAEHAPARTIKEWLDEQAGALLKWSVPISSATRTEWLSAVDGDLFVVQTPARGADPVAALATTGTPVALVGSPAGGLDPRYGLSSSDGEVGEVHRGAALADATPWERAGVPDEFAIHHPYTKNVYSGPGRVVYAVEGSPCLVVDGGVVLWDPPDFQHSVVDGVVRDYRVPLAEAMGSPYAFVLTARVLLSLLRGSAAPVPDLVHPDRPVTVTAWQRADGLVRVLAADLEEGFRADTRGETRLDLAVAGARLSVTLRYAEMALLSVRPPSWRVRCGSPRAGG